jgi:hypothetical protein
MGDVSLRRRMRRHVCLVNDPPLHLDVMNTCISTLPLGFKVACVVSIHQAGTVLFFAQG